MAEKPLMEKFEITEGFQIENVKVKSGFLIPFLVSITLLTSQFGIEFMLIIQ